MEVSILTFLPQTLFFKGYQQKSETCWPFTRTVQRIQQGTNGSNSNCEQLSVYLNFLNLFFFFLPNSIHSWNLRSDAQNISRVKKTWTETFHIYLNSLKQTRVVCYIMKLAFFVALLLFYLELINQFIL